MAKVITFSRVFPSYHPKAGQPTHFVEKMLQWYWANVSDVYRGFDKWHDVLWTLNHNKFSKDFYKKFCDELNPNICDWKSHTIRAGNRIKVDEFIRPVIWTGKPYRSLQMQFLPALHIPKTWDFKFIESGFKVNGRLYDGEIESHHDLLEEIAKNDGLTKHELCEWFNTPEDFTGQIICWNESIDY